MRSVCFETSRLLVGEWNPSRDAASAFSLYGDPEVVKYLGRVPQVMPDEESARQKIAERLGIMAAKEPPTAFHAVVEKSSGVVVGSLICQDCPDGERQPTGDWEIGWHLRKDRWGQGYASEAATGLIGHVFAHYANIRRLIAIAYVDNAASIRVMQKVGMREVGLTTLYYGVETMCYDVVRGE